MLLERVGKHLEAQALRLDSEDDIDSFGRSAFNRYYYAAFWIVRAALAEIDPKWSSIAHAAVPDLLRGAVRNKLEQGLKKAERTGSRGGTLRNQIQTSTGTLAQLMEHAYKKRVEADYSISARVKKTNGALYMGAEKCSSASHWPHRANTSTRNLLNVSKQLGIT